MSKFLPAEKKNLKSFHRGPTMTPAQMVSMVKEIAGKWKYDVVSIGYPGLIQKGRIVREPHNLAPTWMGFDFEAAFGCPVKLINDAAMKALGSIKEVILLFLGLRTGLDSAFVVEGNVVPLELAHLPYKNGTNEDYIGKGGLKHLGKKKWQKHVDYITAVMIAALHPDDVVIGGRNVYKLNELPRGCRAGNNSYAFIGGFRMWEKKSIKHPRRKQSDHKTTKRKYR
jgi:polyphosphate glucokinase